MNKDKLIVKGDKQFLNGLGHHTVASIAYEASVSTHLEDKFYVYSAANMFINDCSRIISLSLDFSNEKEFENSLAKLQTIEVMARQAAADLTELREYFLAEKKRTKKINKKKAAKRKAKMLLTNP